MRIFTPPNTHAARILRFADGDTAVLLIEGLGNWSEKYVRLIGIESYKLDGPDRSKAQAIRLRVEPSFSKTADASCARRPRT